MSAEHTYTGTHMHTQRELWIKTDAGDLTYMWNPKKVKYVEAKSRTSVMGGGDSGMDRCCLKVKKSKLYRKK